MAYILLLIAIIVLILIYFLYSIWKEEEQIEEWIQEESKNEEKANSSMKTSELDKHYFCVGLKNVSMKQTDFEWLKSQLQKKVIWMDEFINSIIVNLLVWWNILVEWVPGLAKTRTVETLSSALDMDFNRIQFTPDMLPSDIIWVEMYNSKKQDFEVKLGPVFSNIILADEINRTTPKVQSALLEAMQEKKVSIWWETYSLPNPFFVLATQNPLEQEGTYPLPEAQVDRFLFKVLVDYPAQNEEKQIVDMLENEKDISIEKSLDINKFLEIQKEVEKVYISEDIRDYIVRLVLATRKSDDRVLYGASPRATIWFFFGAKALAFLEDRTYVTYEDIQRLSLSLLRHRIILSYDAKIDWWTEDQVLLDILPKVSLE